MSESNPTINEEKPLLTSTAGCEDGAWYRFNQHGPWIGAVVIKYSWDPPNAFRPNSFVEQASSDCMYMGSDYSFCMKYKDNPTMILVEFWRCNGARQREHLIRSWYVISEQDKYQYDWTAGSHVRLTDPVLTEKIFIWPNLQHHKPDQWIQIYPV